MITVKQLLQREDFFDAAILRHGFTDYMRDYELIVGARDGPPHTDMHKYQFVGCVVAQYHIPLARPDAGPALARSFPDDFVFSGPDYPAKDDPQGFIWGVRCTIAYPGLTYIDDGAFAEQWSKLLGRTMHEVVVETNLFLLRLVFADVRYAFLGHTPAVTIQKDMPLNGSEITLDGGIR